MSITRRANISTQKKAIAIIKQYNIIEKFKRSVAGVLLQIDPVSSNTKIHSQNITITTSVLLRLMNGKITTIVNCQSLHP